MKKSLMGVMRREDGAREMLCEFIARQRAKLETVAASASWRNGYIDALESVERVVLELLPAQSGSVQCREDVARAFEETRDFIRNFWRNNEIASAPAREIIARIDELEKSCPKPAGQQDGELMCAGGCGRPYSKGPDLVVSDQDWAKIAPRPDGGGVLCPNCMHDRFVAAGIPDYSIPAKFTSGPFAKPAGQLVEGWRTTAIPETKRGTQREFIIAVRRAHSGKVYSFAASYLHAYPLTYQHECPKGDGCAGEGCDDGCPTTGWFIETGEDDDSTQFHSLDLKEGDEFLGWRDVPQWPALSPAPALPQPREGEWQKISDKLADALRHFNAVIADEGGFASPKAMLTRQMASEALDAYLALVADQRQPETKP